MFAGFAYAQGYFAGRQLPSFNANLLVEIATVRSMTLGRTVAGSIDDRLVSLSHVRTVDPLEDFTIASLGSVRTVKGIP